MGTATSTQQEGGGMGVWFLAFLIYQSYKFFWSRLDNGGDALPSLNSPLYNEEFNLRSLVQQHETLLAKKTKLFFYSFSTKRKWINAIKLKERREFYKYNGIPENQGS